MSSNDKKNLLHVYSAQVETRFELKEFELVLEDSNKALEIDSGNFSVLFRKGRVLIGLR